MSPSARALPLALLALAGGAGCLLDFRAGLPCTGDSQCAGYRCRAGACAAPGSGDAGGDLTLCCVAATASPPVGFCTRPCTQGTGACPAEVGGYTLSCDADPAARCRPSGNFCQPLAGYAAWSQLQPSCTRDADCQGQAWPAP